MRNLPEWVVDVRGGHLDRRGVGVAQRVVDRGRARLRPRGLGGEGAGRRPRAGRAHPSGLRAPRRGHDRRAPPGRRGRRRRGPLGGRRRARRARCPTSRSAGATTPPSSTRRARRAVRRARCRRTAPSSRRSPGSGARRPSSRLRSPAEATAASAQPPVFILIVPLFHVTGCVAGVPVVRVERARARDDAQVGAGAGARADRAGAGHELRRRAHAVVGPARVPALRGVRHVEPGQRRWGRGAGAARAREAGGVVVQPGPPDHRLRHDRDQRLRAAELR